MTAEVGTGDVAAPITPKYPRPKILLVDVPEAEKALVAEGYSVSTGSFGTPYLVPVSNQYLPVISNGRLPNFTEQEIVVVNLLPPDSLSGPVGEKAVSSGELDVWAKCSIGEIDPRPRLMREVRSRADRIYTSGGLFVVFAAERYLQDHFIGKTRGYSWPEKAYDFPFDNWDFLSVLDDVRVNSDEGREISVTIDTPKPLERLLREHANGAEFLCTLGPKRSVEGSWVTLAENKYGEPVSGAIAPPDSKGVVLVFPQVEDKGRFLTNLLKNVLPELMPHLFPYAEGARWVQRPQYEIPEIQDLKDQILVVEEEARNRVAELERAIAAEREETSYQHDLIRETGTSLVLAAKKALEILGFKSVVDVDEEMEKAGEKGPKNEDLQIYDNSPTLLVEVKGIAGFPADEDALAVGKYVAPRMREWGRTDVKGLSIINHQRHLPALERDNVMPFRKVILDSAEAQGLGLMTAWDLHKLLRGYSRNGWQHEHIKPLFYHDGRILPVPAHYAPVGVVERLIENIGVVGVRITEGELRQGGRVAFELPVEFLEQDIEALQIGNQQVEEVGVGSLVGTRTPLTKGQARVGTRVFRVTQTVS